MGRRTAPSAEGAERFRAKRDEVSVTCEAPRLRCGDASSRRSGAVATTMRVTMKELAATAAPRLRAPKLRVLHEFHVQYLTSRCSVKFSSAHGGGRGREVCSPASWRCVPRRVSAWARALRPAALSTPGGLGRYWAAQWHLARAVGKRFRGCRAKRLYVHTCKGTFYSTSINLEGCEASSAFCCSFPCEP